MSELTPDALVDAMVDVAMSHAAQGAPDGLRALLDRPETMQVSATMFRLMQRMREEEEWRAKLCTPQGLGNLFPCLPSK